MSVSEADKKRVRPRATIVLVPPPPLIPLLNIPTEKHENHFFFLCIGFVV